LTDRLSIETGIGPECRVRAKGAQAASRPANRIAQRADYSYIIVVGIICIIDHGNGRSVTHDAHAVVADLVAAGIDVDRQPIIYRDTMGIWDRIVVAGGQFAGFAPLQERDQDAAIRRVIAGMPRVAATFALRQGEPDNESSRF
jgi:hypothetical protein